MVPAWINLLLWGIFLMGLSVLGGVFTPKEDEEPKEKFFKLILVILLILGAILFVKAINQGFFTQNQQQNTPIGKQESPLDWIYDFDEGIQKAQTENKIIMVDTYTDWCTACKKLEKKTFLHPDVVEELKSLILVKIDFTKENDQNLMIKEKYGILGFPTVLFLDGSGQVLERFSAYLDQKRFLNILKSAKGK